LIFWLSACAPEAVDAVGAVNLALTSVGADPWANADTMRVVVRRGDVVVVEAEATPGESFELPGLADFGEVEIDVLGLSGDEVISAGRTGPIAVGAGRTAAIEVLVLQVNTAIPLPFDVSQARTGAVAVRGLDGRVRFWGGREGRDSPTSSGDVFSLANGFTDIADTLPVPVAGAASRTLPDRETWIAGGASQATANSRLVRLDAYGLPDLDFDAGIPLDAACVATVDWDRAAILAADPGDPTSSYAWTAPQITQLTARPPRVAACGGLDDGRVITAGDEGGWGVLDVDADQFTSFASPLVLDGTLAVEAGDTVWFVGGTDGAVTFGRGIPVTAAGPDRGIDALDHPRAWASHLPYDDRHVVIFGGFSDASAGVPEKTAEWWQIGGASALTLPVPLARPTAVVMEGGTVLFRGASDDGPAAYLVQPWLEP
jgi:hypothetical protein